MKEAWVSNFVFHIYDGMIDFLNFFISKYLFHVTSIVLLFHYLTLAWLWDNVKARKQVKESDRTVQEECVKPENRKCKNKSLRKVYLSEKFFLCIINMRYIDHEDSNAFWFSSHDSLSSSLEIGLQNKLCPIKFSIY